MGEYKKSKLLKYSREYLGLTQEQLAEGICDPLTLNRYENGKINPTDEKYGKLMAKMGFSQQRYILDSSEKKNSFFIKNQILTYIQQMRFDEVSELLYELEKTIHNKNNISYIQFVRRIELIIEWHNGKISADQLTYELIKLLKISFDDCLQEQIPTNKIMTLEELLIINDIAISYGVQYQYEEACKWFKRIEEYNLSEIILNNHKPRYKILLNYSNYLGLSNRYDECLHICYEGIRCLKKQHRANMLYNFYFNIGWVMHMKYKSGEDCLQKAQENILLAIDLCDYYSESRESLQQMKAYYTENFG